MNGTWLDIADLLWNIPLMFFALGACWKLLNLPRGAQPWHLWPWYVGVAGTWCVNIWFEYAQGDTLWGIVSVLLFAVNAGVGVVYFYEDKWAKEREQARRLQAERFEKFRIDDK